MNILKKSSEEMVARRCVSKEVRACFICSESEKKRAWKALLALRPSRKKGKRLTLTHRDLFCGGAPQLCELPLEQQLVMMPEVVDFILRDKDFGESEWSGLIFVGIMLRSRRLYDACNPHQRSAIANFIEHLMKYRVVRHGCEIFMDQFEYSLILWRDSKWSCDG